MHVLIGGYLHDADDDTPYTVDGLWYCGRCHHVCGADGTCTRIDPPEHAGAPTCQESRQVAEPDEIAAIRAWESAATSGPWTWNVNLKSRHMRLEGRTNGNETVVDCERWGMAGAQFVVRDMDEAGYNGRLAKAIDFAAPIEGREHHKAWCQTFAHPDLDFIARSRSAIPTLLAHIDAQAATIATLEAERDALDDLNARLTAKLAHAHAHCACEYDTADDVCLAHSRLVQVERLRAEAAESTIATLTTQRDDARRDGERLDWLQQNMCVNGGSPRVGLQRWWIAPALDSETFDTETERDAYTLRVAVDLELNATADAGRDG